MTKSRFQRMSIKLGELCESIAPFCNAKNNTWNELTQVHLKIPKTNGNALLKDTRIFALELDKETTIAKISSGFDNIDDLTLKITSKSLSKLSACKLFEMIVRDGSWHSKAIKITQVFKGMEHDHAYIVTSFPKQRRKVLRSSLAIEGELISPALTREKLTAAEITKKNCLIIITKNFNKDLSPDQVECNLRTLIGGKNIINIYFPRAEDGMHTGLANIEFLNAPIYKKFVKKTHKLQGK
jgi:chaperonin GroEL (HSP60 family)